jgi:hypothetical protein
MTKPSDIKDQQPRRSLFKNLLIAGVLALVMLVLMWVLFIPFRQYANMSRGGKSAAVYDLRRVANAVFNYSKDTKSPRLFPIQPGDTVHEVAFILTPYLNWDDVYIFPEDPQAPKDVDLAVSRQGAGGKWELNPDFARATLSIEMAANISLDAPPDTTPVAWTRGLQADGTWAADAPLENKHGYIAFLSGNVIGAEKLSTEAGGTSLTKYGTHEPTINILEALPPGAVVLSAGPKAAGK